MSSVLSYLQNITEEQASSILKEYDGMPKPDYQEACFKARGAATMLRKATWSTFTMAHINALLMGLNRIKFSDSYAVIKLTVAIECYSFAVMGQLGLGYEDFNLAVGPIAGVLAPELFAEEQTWTQEPVPKAEYVRPAYRSRRARAVKPAEESLDLVGLVDSLVKEASTSMAQPTPRTSFHSDQTAAPDVLDMILEGVNKAR